jgi:hypothetical protein
MRAFSIFFLVSLATSPLSPAAGDEVKQAMADATRFSHAGEFAKALERHEWIHANALRVDPAYRGVRLSFALSNWVELGKKYPPALVSLKNIRDQDVRQLEAGAAGPDLFQDVAAINRYLDESDQTIPLFKKLAAAHPELARKSSVFVLDQFLKEKEYGLFQRYAGDFTRYLAAEIDRYDTVAKIIREKRPDETSIPGGGTLVEETLALAKLAAGQGDAALAEKLKAMTFKSLPDPRLAP